MRKILRNIQFIVGVRTNQASVVKKSLLNGADINHCDMQGKSALYMVIDRRNLDLLKILIDHDVDVMEEDGQTPLRIACGEGNVNITKYLLEKNAEVDLGVYDTPLQIASSMGYVEIVSLLLEFGAEVDWRDKDGRTALFYAKAHGQKKIERMLKNHGADTGIIDRYGISIKDLERKEMRKRAIWEI